jgi:hypothetical protein
LQPPSSFGKRFGKRSAASDSHSFDLIYNLLHVRKSHALISHLGNVIATVTRDRHIGSSHEILKPRIVKLGAVKPRVVRG